jgi:hypothetical protein
MKNFDKIIVWALLACIVIIIILSITTCNSSQRAGVAENNLLALNDTVTYYKDSEGRTVAQKRVLEVNNKTLIQLNSDKDSMLLILQKLVKENKNTTSASVIKIITKETGAGVTVVRDTIVYDSIKMVYEYPTYYYSFGGEYLTGDIEMSEDTTKWDIKFHNYVTVSHEYKKNGFFKPKYPVVKVTSLNPYSSIEDIASYTVPAKKDFRIGIGPMIGYGISIPDFKPQGFIGVGVTYSVIKF